MVAAPSISGAAERLLFQRSRCGLFCELTRIVARFADIGVVVRYFWRVRRRGGSMHCVWRSGHCYSVPSWAIRSKRRASEGALGLIRVGRRQ